MKKDRIRDLYLTGLGFQVIRFPSTEVFGNIEGIVDEIFERLPMESPRPPFEKGGVRGLKKMNIWFI
jgi:very-short-patch-repair endonuclease